jgi:pre-rRNA-processing protein TSR1
VNDLDSRQETLNVLRILCTTNPKGIHWREDRSWMAVESAEWQSSKTAESGRSATSDVILTGVIRGKPLKADRLVSIGDWGDFQITKITAAPQSKSRKVKGEGMTVDAEGYGQLIEQPGEDRDDLEELAPEDIAMDDLEQHKSASLAVSERKGVLIDDHHYYSDEEIEETEQTPRRLPRGTSKYQAAWYIGDVSDSGSDLEDVEEDEEMDLGDQAKDFADGVTDIDMREPTEAGPSEYPQSEAFLDPAPEDEADQIAAYRDQRHKDAEEDFEFPDEIELHPNVLARERLARYRGLKNLRTSVWDADEDKLHEPEEWSRLLEISNYKAARNRIMKENLIGGIAPGTRVHVHINGVPSHLQHSYDPAQPLALYCLLRHEHKRTALNYSITLSSNIENPVKSKEEILVQCGPRRFLINPLFSSAGQTPNDVHKFNRFLHPGQSAVASFTGPLTWGSVPVLYFATSHANEDSDSMDTSGAEMLQFIGTGTSLPPSHTRVIAKRIILTGHPYKIHRRVVTVRYMFFNASDVAWFKALRLWTRRGRSGFIKESLGTHGYFKATFDGKVSPMDAVAVSLYKRVWPRPARRWLGQSETQEEAPDLIVS